eukprot:8165614-Heterocapsa_arctica.AAC.1
MGWPSTRGRVARFARQPERLPLGFPWGRFAEAELQPESYDVFGAPEMAGGRRGWPRQPWAISQGTGP